MKMKKMVLKFILKNNDSVKLQNSGSAGAPYKITIERKDGRNFIEIYAEDLNSIEIKNFLKLVAEVANEEHLVIRLFDVPIWVLE